MFEWFISDFNLQEYTEEIERLRRDLEAAREKNGVYIAHENYTHMLLQIEQQEEEIMKKIASLKAIKEEMDKKEASNFFFPRVTWIWKIKKLIWKIGN